MKQFEKVVAYIEERVANKQLEVGEKLPSIRALAKRLSLSHASVIKGYQHLEAARRIYIIPKSGYYLLEQPKADPIGSTPYRFNAMTPDPALIPFREFQHCLDQAIDQYKKTLFQYSDTRGLEDLRGTLQVHLSERQIFCTSEHIVMTTGSQQALTLIVQLLYQRTGKGILMEQPSYGVFRDYIALNGIPVGGFSRGQGGIDFNGLKKQLETGAYSVIYTIPRAHNPLGTHLLEKDKKRLIQLAQKYDVYIIEDDYLADLTGNPKNLPLHFYDVSGHVIYVKSFSKAFLPGIRLGMAVIPSGLLKDYVALKRAHDLNTEALNQGALAIFIKSGLYDRHVKKCRVVYHRKTAIAKQILSQIHHPEVTVGTLESEFLIWLTFGEKFPYNALMAMLKAKDVLVTEDDAFFIAPPSDSRFIRLCTASLSEESLKKGLSLLVSSIQKLA